MKYAKTLIWIFFVLADVSLIVGVIAKISGFAVFGLGPLSYLRFAGICLMYVIAISLSQISLTEKQ